MGEQPGNPPTMENHSAESQDGYAVHQDSDARPERLGTDAKNEATNTLSEESEIRKDDQVLEQEDTNEKLSHNHDLPVDVEPQTVEPESPAIHEISPMSDDPSEKASSTNVGTNDKVGDENKKGFESESAVDATVPVPTQADGTLSIHTEQEPAAGTETVNDLDESVAVNPSKSSTNGGSQPPLESTKAVDTTTHENESNAAEAQDNQTTVGAAPVLEHSASSSEIADDASPAVIATTTVSKTHVAESTLSVQPESSTNDLEHAVSKVETVPSALDAEGIHETKDGDRSAPPVVASPKGSSFSENANNETVLSTQDPATMDTAMTESESPLVKPDNTEETENSPRVRSEKDGNEDGADIRAIPKQKCWAKMRCRRLLQKHPLETLVLLRRRMLKGMKKPTDWPVLRFLHSRKREQKATSKFGSKARSDSTWIRPKWKHRTRLPNRIPCPKKLTGQLPVQVLRSRHRSGIVVEEAFTEWSATVYEGQV